MSKKRNKQQHPVWNQEHTDELIKTETVVSTIEIEPKAEPEPELELRQFPLYGIEEIKPKRYVVVRQMPGQEPEPISIECLTYGEVFGYLRKAIDQEFKSWWQ